MEEGKRVATIVRPQVLYLALDEGRELVNKTLKSLIVKLVQNAQVEHSIPLLPPHLIVRVVRQL